MYLCGVRTIELLNIAISCISTTNAIDKSRPFKSTSCLLDFTPVQNQYFKNVLIANFRVYPLFRVYQANINLQFGLDDFQKQIEFLFVIPAECINVRSLAQVDSVS